MGLEIGPLHIRRGAYIGAPATAVWEHFCSEDAIKAWLDQGHTVHEFDPRPGGRARLSVEIDGERRYFGGAVLVVEPQRELSIESQWEGTGAWPVPTFWTFRLTSQYDGTLVELIHHGFERLGSTAGAELESYERGWSNQHLAALRQLIEG